ncbi:MAG: GntR family transcriptional regulator [Acidobacteriota bacterium]|jgi:GntR family transcriptional regulator
MNIPFYIQVAATIRRRILADEYGHGEILPSSEQLEKEFSVSAITVRKALEILARQGYILRRRGIGTTVSKPGSEVITFELGGTFRRFIDSLEKELLGSEVLDLTVGSCPTHVRKMLSLNKKQRVFCVKKIRRYAGVPIGYYLHYSEARLCKGITRKKVETNLFLELFEQASKLKLTRMEESIRAAITDIDLSKILKTEFGSPLFFIENVFFDSRNRPATLTHIYHRGDMCSYRANVKL